MRTETINYVYAYLDPRTTGPVVYDSYSFEKIPYYIGISKYEERKFSHIYEAIGNNYKTLKLNLIRKLIKIFGQEVVEANIVIVKDNLTREEACELETKLIALIGRRDLNQGPLVNHTAGADGGIDLSGEPLYRRNRNISKSLIGARSCYSYTPESTAKANGESMTKWFDQNRNKTFSDLPKMTNRRYYSNTTHSWSGSHNGNSSFYYLIVDPNGIYHLAGLGCMRTLAKSLGIPYVTIECSARENERRTDGKFTRIMRGSGIGHFAFRFKSIKLCPVDITMGNQHPRPRLPG